MSIGCFVLLGVHLLTWPSSTSDLAAETSCITSKLALFRKYIKRFIHSAGADAVVTADGLYGSAVDAAE